MNSNRIAIFPKSARTIRFRVTALVLMIVIPMLCMFLWLALNFANAKRSLIEMQRLNVTHRVSAAIDGQVVSYLGMLTGLSGANDLANGNYADFRNRAALLATQAHINDIWAISSNGLSVPGTSTSGGEPGATAVMKQAVSRVFAGRQFVSAVHGKTMKGAKVYIGVPVFDANKVIYGIVAEVLVGHLSATFSAQNMEPQWVAAVVDRNGRYIARSLNAEKRLGTLAKPELAIAARSPDPEGVFENLTYENARVHNAYRRSDLTGWTTVVAVPSSEINLPITTALTWVALGAIAIALASLAGAWTMARRISEPVGELARYASALASGTPHRLPNQKILELEEVKQALDRAMAQSARLAAIVASSGDAIISVDLDGKIRTWNKGAEALLGFEEAEIIGKPKLMIVPADRRAEYEEQWNSVLSGVPVQRDTTRLSKSQREIDVSVTAAPIRSANGLIIGVSSIIHDITERKAAAEHVNFLMKELAHRSKNQLAIIQSIAGQTARRTDSIEGFLTTFRQRLQGIAASHDLLSSHDWKGADLEDLVRQHIGIVADARSAQVTIEGAHVNLDARHSEAIGLAIHELATNSIKYGALSQASGKVTIRWIMDAVDGGRKIRLEWLEAGGPTVAEPTSKGFGSQVIEKLITQSISGTSQITYCSSGIRWKIEFTIRD